MNIRTISLIAVIAFLSSCAAINMNHYQDGRSAGKNKYKANIGIGSGLSFITDTTKVDDQNYDIRTKRGPVSIFLSGSVQGGITDNMDIGGELFTTFGSTGFKLFGKYALLDSTSKFAIAMMPVLGFSFPWFEEDEEDEYTDELTYTARSFIMEFAMPVSFHPDNDLAIILTPKVYYHHNFVTQTTGDDVNYHRKGSGTYFSPGASVGLHFYAFRIEGTIVHLDENNWMPYFGISISPKKLFSKKE